MSTGIIIIILILIATIVVMGYALWNLLRKHERAEDLIIKQQEYITSIYQAILMSKKKLEEIDSKGTFKADDEIGWFFKNILYIQDILNEYVNEDEKK